MRVARDIPLPEPDGDCRRERLSPPGVELSREWRQGGEQVNHVPGRRREGVGKRLPMLLKSKLHSTNGLKVLKLNKCDLFAIRFLANASRDLRNCLRQCKFELLTKMRARSYLHDIQV